MGARRGPPAPPVCSRVPRVPSPPGNSRTDGVSKVGSRPLHFLCVPVARTPTHPRAPAAGAPARGTGGRHARPAVGGSATAPCGRPTPWRPACPPRTASYSHSDNNRSAPLSAYALGCSPAPLGTPEHAGPHDTHRRAHRPSARPSSGPPRGRARAHDNSRVSYLRQAKKQ